MDMYRNYPPLLIVDVETRPLPDAASYIVPGRPPANYKKAEAIAAWQEDDKAEQLAKAALDPDLCELTCVGWKVPGSEIFDVDVVGEYRTESEIIASFGQNIGPGTILVGYNVRFDVMVVRRRALYLGVPFPTIDVGKYRANGILDLQDILSYTGNLKFRSLTWYCKRFGLDVPEDTLTGADMLTATSEQIRAHNLADLVKTEALARRLGVLGKTV
jgi:hypothetical protein